MKKPTLVFAVLAVIIISFVSFSAFKSNSSAAYAKQNPMAAVVADPNQTCPTSCSCVLTDDCCPSGSGCTTGTGCSSDWKVPNFTWSKTGTTVNFSSLDICYKPSSTPPWTSFNRIGTMTNWTGIIFVPSTTKVFTATSLSGATFQCTLYNTGAFYIQHTGGTVPAKGVSISGSYTL